MKWCGAIGLLLVWFGTAAAQMSMVPKDFFNDTLLSAAQEDIAKLGIEELRLLADALAECNNPYDATGVARGCSVKSMRFLIEHGEDNALGQMWEVASTSFALSAQMTAKERTDFYRRSGRIVSGLSTSVTEQFRRLRKR